MTESNNNVSYVLPGSIRNQQENIIFQDINQRLTLLEEATFKKVKRKRATEAQRFLILDYLGLVNPITELKQLQQHQKASIISQMIDIDPDNAEKFLAELSNDEKPKLNTVSNYKYLVTFFEELNLTELQEKAEKVLQQIEQELEDKEKRKAERRVKK